MLVFEDFTPGRVFALPSYAVTREEALAFAAEFDPQPFHLDEAAAATGMLGGLSASGWHSCAMMMRMMCDGFLLQSTSQGSPGVDHVRWLAPVRPGSTLTGEARVLSARLSAKRPTLGIAKVETVLDADGQRVLESEYALLLLTRAGART